MLAIFNPKNGIPKTAAARIQRWAVLLTGYVFDIKYQAGIQNISADCLSRLNNPRKFDDGDEWERGNNKMDSGLIKNISHAGNFSFTVEDLIEETRRDELLQKVIEECKNGWKFNVPHNMNCFKNRKNEISYVDGLVLLGKRIIIPKRLQRSVLKKLHVGHMGLQRTKALARSYMWWPNIDNDIDEANYSCTNCQEEKRKMPPKAQTSNWEECSRPMERIHVDFAGPINGLYFLIMVDSFSKWPEVIPMECTNSSQTVSTMRTIFSRLGIPETLVSDNGPQFISREMREFTRNNNIRHAFISAYHPASNGLAERFVQTFKGCFDKGEDDIQRSIDRFLIHYRNTPHTVTRVEPSVRMMGRKIRCFFDTLKNVPRKTEEKCERRTRVLVPGDNVLLRNFLKGPKWIRGRVTEVLADVLTWFQRAIGS